MLVQKKNFTSRGCFACVRRKIKCDEQKPNCNKCSRYGNICPGYRQLDDLRFRNITSADQPLTAPLRQREWKPRYVQDNEDTGKVSFLIGRLPPSWTTLRDAQEAESLHYFRTLAAQDFQGYLRSDFWRSAIYQRSLSLPAVHLALLAVSDAHREWVTDPSASFSRSTLSRYGKALHATIAGAKTSRTQETLFGQLYTCILLYYFELLKRDDTAANIHLDNGLRLLRAWQSTVSEWPPLELSRSNTSMFYQLLYTFGRLDVDRSLSGSPSHHFAQDSRLLRDGLQSALATPPDSFTLGCYLLFLSRDTLEITRSNRHFYANFDTQDPERLLDEQNCLNQRIYAILKALDKFQGNGEQISMSGRQKLMAIYIMRLYLMSSQFRLANICTPLSARSEQSILAHEHANRMVECAEKALGLRCVPPLKQGFMPQPGIIAPLRMLVDESTDELLRIRALAVIASLKS